MFKRMSCLIASAILPVSALAVLPVHDTFNYIENATTALNTADQLLNQAKMIQYQLANLKQLPSSQWQRVAQLSSQLNQLTAETERLSTSMKRMNAQYESNFPTLNKDNLNQYQPSKTQQSTLNTLHESSNALADSTQFITKQQSLLNSLHSQSQSSQGQIQAMQTANNIALANIQQLQNIQKMMALKAQADLAHDAQKEEQEHYETVLTQKIADKLPVESPGYKNNSNFGLIKKMS